MFININLIRKSPTDSNWTDNRVSVEDSTSGHNNAPSSSPLPSRNSNYCAQMEKSTSQINSTNGVNTEWRFRNTRGMTIFYYNQFVTVKLTFGLSTRAGEITSDSPFFFIRPSPYLIFVSNLFLTARMKRIVNIKYNRNYLRNRVHESKINTLYYILR